MSSTLTPTSRNLPRAPFAPEPPPIDEKWAALGQLPLLMQSLPDDPSDNVALSALQSLIHEGTPDGECMYNIVYFLT
jgi:hypothetical protein